MHNREHKKAIYPFTEQDFARLSDTLYAPLKYKENVVLMCPPLYGRDHRVMQLWERKQDRDRVLGEISARLNFLYINVINTDANPEALWLHQMGGVIDLKDEKQTSFEDFEKHIKRTLQDQDELVFFVNIPETLSDDYFSRFLALAQKIYYISPPQIHFILIFDMKWDEDRFYEITSPFRSLFQNTKLLSLYPLRETRHFIHYYSQLWKLTLNKQIIDYIAEYSGGIMLLAKSALRIIRNEKVKSSNALQSIIQTHIDHKLQIDFFIRRLTTRQQVILEQIASAGKTEDMEVYHLEQMGIIIKTQTGWRIKAKFIENYLTRKTDSFTQKRQLILNNDLFTSREKKILAALLREPEIIVSRNIIAQVLWGEENYEKYSDWAIDQSISRIRKKIKVDSALSKFALYTHKKLGFSLK